MGREVGRRGNGVQRREKSRVFLLGLFRPLEWGQRMRRTTEGCYGAGKGGAGLARTGLPLSLLASAVRVAYGFPGSAAGKMG